MNHFDFTQLCGSADRETAIRRVFDEAHEQWEDQGLDSLTEGQLTVLAVEWYFGEVLNGGFYQYFSNQSGGLALFTASALRRVGLTPYAAVLEAFLKLFPSGAPSHDAEIRQIQLDTLADQFEEEFFENLETPFWDLYFQNKTEFRDRLFAYVVANEQEFVS